MLPKTAVRLKRPSSSRIDQNSSRPICPERNCHSPQNIGFHAPNLGLFVLLRSLQKPRNFPPTPWLRMLRLRSAARMCVVLRYPCWGWLKWEQPFQGAQESPQFVLRSEKEPEGVGFSHVVGKQSLIFQGSAKTGPFLNLPLVDKKRIRQGPAFQGPGRSRQWLTILSGLQKRDKRRTSSTSARRPWTQ